MWGSELCLVNLVATGGAEDVVGIDDGSAVGAVEEAVADVGGLGLGVMALDVCGEGLGQDDVRLVVGLGEEGSDFVIAEAGDAAADAGDEERQVGTAGGKGDELVNVRLDGIGTSMHGGDGIALALKADALSPYGTEMLVGDAGSTAAVLAGEVAAKNENLVLLQGGDVFWCIIHRSLLDEVTEDRAEDGARG